MELLVIGLGEASTVTGWWLFGNAGERDCWLPRIGDGKRTDHRLVPVPSSIASDRAAARLSCFNGSNSSTEMEQTARVDRQPRRKEKKEVKRRGDLES